MTNAGFVEGKVVVVTGAGGGIGREIALAMAQHRARVVVNDIGTSLSGDGRDAGPAERVAAEIADQGGQAVANTDSVAEAAGARGMIAAAIDAFGRVDCVVNNAGILRDRFFQNMSEEEWDAVVKVHLYGAYHVSRAAAPIMKEQAAGSLIHMTSTSGLIGNRAQANYSAAKMGIVALSKSIALDLQRYNVRSNCVAPFAWSRMISNIKADSPEQQARVDKIRQMTPAKIAPLTVFLASDAAADVNGQIFSVRNNEIFLISQPRPIRSVHRAEGWTPETVAAHAMPALKSDFFPLDVSADVFSWAPV